MSPPSGNEPPRPRALRNPPSPLLREAERIFNLDPRAATFQPSNPTTPTVPPRALAPASAAAGEGFGQLPDGGDISDPHAWPSARELAKKLLDPPRQSYSVHHKRIGFIHIQLRWVLRAVGEPHFRNDKTLSRSVLKENSKLRTHGLEAGMPEGYWRWLCGNREGGASGPDKTEYWIPEAEFYLRPNQIAPPQTLLPASQFPLYGAIPQSQNLYGVPPQYQQRPQ